MAPLLLKKGSLSSTSVRDMLHLLMCRNEITALRKYSMDTFEHRWESISEAIIRLGGDVYISLCRELKMTPLDYIDPDDKIFLGDM
ncbi:Hypothetical predicted protein [Mytilus galloprovincialis]|uniref:Uncharacterized protein n=1 Tax=Mytilus galloprovincialis TaxID=29158 RepID=A0A8B6FJ76_MYTGA|nr:Hypothetical predicted protein [Mytilus galloprovincialis]